MDLLRLALERAATAAEAVVVITELLAALPAATPIFSIRPSAIAGLAARGPRDFLLRKRRTSPPPHRHVGVAGSRRRGGSRLAPRPGPDRPHRLHARRLWSHPLQPTTGSLVCHLHPDHPSHFVTGTAAPCTSLFKPVWLDAPLPDTGPPPGATYDASTQFWRHERLHRATLQDYPTRIGYYRSERDGLEAQFVAGALERAGLPPGERAALRRTVLTRPGRPKPAGWRRSRALPASRAPTGSIPCPGTGSVARPGCRWMGGKGNSLCNSTW